MNDDNDMIVERVVSDTLTWMNLEVDDADMRYIAATPEDKLISLHHSLGTEIRNRSKLWLREWTPQIVNGVDMSPNHPDAISMSAIKEIWKRLNQRTK